MQLKSEIYPTTMLTVSVRLSSDTSCISRISCIRRISYRCTIYRQNTNNVSCWTYYTTIQILITTLKLLNFYGGTYTVNATSRSGPIAPLIQDGGRRPSWISWNANLSATDRCLHQIRWEDVSRPGEDDHVTKSRNRTLVCVTSSNDVWSISASISMVLIDIWTKFGTVLKHHTINMPESAKFTQLENRR